MLKLAQSFSYKSTTICYILVSCLLYLYFAYYLQRTETLQLLIVYSSLFIVAHQIIKSTSGSNKVIQHKLLIGLALLFRLLFLFATPNLSQDFYRFIWDGNMTLAGLNPYLQTPNAIIAQTKLPFLQAQELYTNMGPLSAKHYTNYPPINQLCFVLGNLFPGSSILSSVIGMRLLILASDFGIYYFGKKILNILALPSQRIFWYMLNPFIIIECTGNLHFESVMLCLLLWSLYLLHKKKWQWAAFVFAGSISVKLIPLMFLPLFFWWFVSVKKDLKKQQYPFFKTISAIGLKRLICFYCIIILTTLGLFLPFFSTTFITNYTETVALWFGNFEFNASIYYILREVGFAISGYNQIAIISKILAITAVIIIIVLAFKKHNIELASLINTILISYSCYLFLSTTVHPWYLCTLVILSVFTNYKFPLVWSFVIVLSYLSYLDVGNAKKAENLWIIALEYLIVFVVFFIEQKREYNKKLNQSYCSSNEVSS